MSRTGLSRAIALALLAGVVLVAFFLTALPQDGAVQEGSARSSAPGGRLAAYLLLRDLGFDPHPWRAAPGKLPRGRSVLLLPQKPEDPPDYLREIWDEMDAEEKSGAEPSGAARRQRDPRHYRRFLEEGGVIVAGLDEEREAFFRDELELDLDAAVEGERPFPEHQAVATRDGETLDLDWSAMHSAARGGTLRLPPGAGRALLADAEHPSQAFAVSVPVGRGELVLVPNDGFIDNRALPNGDNALVLVRLVEELAPFEALYFDEYALGGALPDSPIALALAPRGFPLTLHLLLLACVALWWLAWAGPFPRDPEPLAETSPAARARAQGALLARLGQYDALARALRRGVEAELPGADRRRLDAGEEEGRRAERALAHLDLSAEERAAFAAALSPSPVGSAGELGRLARTLARLERLSRSRPRTHNPLARR